jgi:hypothetical protein
MLFTNRFKVQPNKTLTLNGERFIARGVQMFDYLLCSFEPNRDNYNFRKLLEPEGKGYATGISEPTYYARLQYKNSDYVLSQLIKANDMGANLIRLSIEPAIRYASVCYIDPVDNLEYPSDTDMLDTIINHAESLGMVVQLQNANDTGSIGENSTFLAWLADRYKAQWNVWINPANELNGMNNGGANVNDHALWQTTMQSHVNAIRNAGFSNPICLDPPGWAERIDLVAGYLNTNPVFRDDPNLIIQTHYYPAAGENDFRTDKLPAANGYWVNYIPNYCIIVGEVGIDNLAGRLDPNMDDAVPSVNLTAWGNAQAAVTDFLKWCNEKTLFSNFSGCIGHMWQAHSRVSGLNDDNVMHNKNGTRTTWGTIYRNNFLSPPVFNLSQLVISMPALLGPKMGNGSVGTPEFQAEGKSGVRAAAAFISPNASSPIVPFFRRDNGTMIGLISGNGSGLTYGTTSDYRLKSDLAEMTVEEIEIYINNINPVLATWNETGVREPVFIAHEVQEIMPSAVTGEKDGEEYQTVDYAKLVPVLFAAIKHLIKLSKE